jgi:hypothetical protein
MERVLKQPSPLESLKKGKRKVIDKAIYLLLDRYWYLHQFVRRGEKASGEFIPPEVNPSTQLSLFGGREGVTATAQERLRDVFMPLRKHKAELVEYLTHMRFLERANRGLENPGGVTAQEAVKVLTDLRKEVGPEVARQLVQAGRDFQSWAETEILQRMVDSKALSPGGLARIKAKNRFWLPFEVEADDKKLDDLFNIDNYKEGDNFFAATQNVLFEVSGTTKRMSDPLETVMKRLILTVNFTEKNKILVDLINMRSKNPWMKRHIKRVQKASDVPPTYGQFGVVINGKVRKWAAPANVIESLKQMNTSEFHFLDKAMSKAGAIFRAGTTAWYLPFSIFNIHRDMQMAMVTSKYGFGPKIWTEGFIHALSSSFGLPTKLYKDYLESKAGFGGLIQHEAGRGPFKSTGRPVSAKKLFKTKAQTFAEETLNPAKFIKNVAQTFEIASRLGVYKQSLKNVESPFEAALLSRRATIDFYRAGQAMKIANRWIPFINARVQAKVSLAEALMGKRGSRRGKGKFLGIEGDPRIQAFVRGTAIITLPALATYAYNRIYHNDLYNNLSDDYKDRYFPIIIGSQIDEDTGNERINILPIPKGDWGALVFNPLQNFLDYAWEKEPIKTKDMLIKLLNEFSPLEFEREGKFAPDRLLAAVSPPPLRGLSTIATGKDLYWGGDIVPASKQKVAPEEQYNEYTHGFYKWVGKKLKVSPMLSQQFARDLFGSLFASPSAPGLLDSMKRRIIRDVGGKTVGDVYKIKDRAEEGYYTARLRALRLLEAGDKAGARKLVEEWNKQMRPIMEEVAKTINQSPDVLMKSSFYKRYSFQESDWKRLLKSLQQGKQRPLDKSLGVEIK